MDMIFTKNKDIFLIKMSFFTKYRVNLEKKDDSNNFRYFLDWHDI
jgi:hypothetical protein